MRAFLTILFTTFCLFASAQTFNEKTFMDISQRIGKDPAQYVKTEAVPDFILVGSTGAVFNLERFLALVAGTTTESWSISDLKVRQYGVTAVATGIVSHSHKFKSDGSLLVFKELFTYTFSHQNGKWLAVSWQHTDAPTDIKQDEAAIKAVVERETQAFLDRDAAAFLDCHINKPYSLLLVGEHGNVHYFTSPNSDMDKTLTAVLQGLGKSNGDSFKNTDYVIRINGNSAFTYFDQTGLNTTNAENKTPEVSHQTRYLERVNGLWKIVYVGGLGAKP